METLRQIDFCFCSFSYDRGYVIHLTRARTRLVSALRVWTLTGCLDSDWLLIGRSYCDEMLLDECLVGLGCDWM